MYRTILFLGVGILCPLTMAAQIYLQYQLAPRASYAYENTSRVSQHMTVNEQYLTTQIGVDTKFLVRVKDAILKQYTLDCVYDTVLIRSSVTGIESIAPKKDSSIVFSALAGAVETLTIAPNGSILSTTMTMNEESKAILAAMSSNVMSGMKRFFITYPTKEITQGDSWATTFTDTTSTRSMKGSVITTISMSMRYERSVDTLGFHCAVISSTSTKLNVAGTIQQAGMDMTIDGDGTTKGTTFIDVTDGMPVLSTSNLDMDTRLAMVGQASMIIPLQMESLVILRRVGLK